jgi:hypothetical protein
MLCAPSTCLADVIASMLDKIALAAGNSELKGFDLCL